MSRAASASFPDSPPGPAALGRLGEALEKCLRNPRQTRPTVQAVKSHLDALQDGVSALQLYGAELTAEAIQAVKDAHRVLAYEAAQLTDAGIDPVNVTQAVTRVSTHLAADRPWLDIGALSLDSRCGN